MSERILNKRNYIIGHVVFWIISASFFCIIFYFNSKSFNTSLVAKAIITNIGFAASVYINLYVLIPRFLKKKSYIFYFFWLIVTLSASSLLVQLIIVYPLRNVLHVSEEFASFNTNTHSAFFFVTLIYVGIFSFFKMVKDWIAMQDLNFKLAKIEKQKLEAELTTLKGQLNPHFLFNSLNNIYSLALVKSDKVPELILKLSDLMRHIIYESREDFISLQKEIEFVDNFIALQKIRVSDQTSIIYEKIGDVPSARIAPLLFEPFIDNAFKHGIPGDIDKDYIRISFDFQQDSSVVFHIENNYSEVEKWNTKHSGIGLQNVKQRLSLLYKKDEFKLDIKREYPVFGVKLHLKLK
ncbi:GHKL domain-containing protein [Maribellus luteus]|uniref:GHKL domain-containing protein n=1 Tax=Maribellus luteus TaxID=2305463 RepID=A0A399SXG3_9BACT|nr:histidine kinase [Maribellus luteus]RIJ47332.1 GHKL domain-containing protein [Maribellus luteus]